MCSYWLRTWWPIKKTPYVILYWFSFKIILCMFILCDSSIINGRHCNNSTKYRKQNPEIGLLCAYALLFEIRKLRVRNRNFCCETTTMFRFVIRMFDQNTSVVLKRPSMKSKPSIASQVASQTTRSPYILMHSISNIVYRIRKVI